MPGYYFVTICVKHGLCELGRIHDGRFTLSPFGKIVHNCWHDLPKHYSHVTLDAFVIMPNHIHGVIVLDDTIGAGFKPAPTQGAKRHGLPEIVRAFKTFSARRINELRDAQGVSFWQRNYYEHIIRNERSLNAIRYYIHNNPAKWMDDQLHPDAPPNKFNSSVS